MNRFSGTENWNHACLLSFQDCQKHPTVYHKSLDDASPRDRENGDLRGEKGCPMEYSVDWSSAAVCDLAWRRGLT